MYRMQIIDCFHSKVSVVKDVQPFKKILLNLPDLKTYRMKIITLLLFLLISTAIVAQNICNPAGNVVLFSNYDGGVLDINVDVNIPNLKIGVVSYEMVTVNITGAFASNVTEVQFAGYTTTTHHHCTNSPVVTSIVGAPPGTDTLIFMPPSPVPNSNGYYIIICNYSCDTNVSQGGCNTADQVAAYFLQEFGGALRFHKTQYGCWTGMNSLSAGGNCCVGAVTSPALPVAALQSSDTSFCDKQCINFFDLSTNNPTSWQWYFPGSDSLTSSQQNPVGICYNNYGSFDVTLIACNAAGCDTLLLPGFINEYPLPAPTITQSNDTLFSSPGVNYQWWNVDSGIINGANNYFFVPPYGGDYYVIVTDSVGCAGTSNVISVSFAGINDFIIQPALLISPNPAKEIITLTLNKIDAGNCYLEITDITGRLVMSQNFHSFNNKLNESINIKSIKPGFYNLTIITEKYTLNKKLLINR